jgi:hypothetical protein
MKLYEVVLKYQFPAWDEVSGISFEVEAGSKQEAIKSARRIANDEGHIMSGKGRSSFKAVEAHN